VVGNAGAFSTAVQNAFQTAEQGRLVVIGLQPRWADTGYGYIEFPQEVETGSVSPVLRFREKPDEATARQYVESGRFFWNSGMFFWRADAFLKALREHRPAIADIIDALPPFTSRRFVPALREAYPRCEDISVDYAVMESAENVVGFPAGDLEWSDVGSWHAVYELLPRDAAGNAARSELLSVASAGNYVDAGRKLVALLGVRDLVIVDTPDALLVTDRKQAQKVGELVKLLEKQGRDELL
jgi:mannose-1-phosphate guanylyltransferase/mannose-6-phosphate isomerase